MGVVSTTSPMQYLRNPFNKSWEFVQKQANAFAQTRVAQKATELVGKIGNGSQNAIASSQLFAKSHPRMVKSAIAVAAAPVVLYGAKKAYNWYHNRGVVPQATSISFDELDKEHAQAQAKLEEKIAQLPAHDVDQEISLSTQEVYEHLHDYFINENIVGAVAAVAQIKEFAQKNGCPFFKFLKYTIPTRDGNTLLHAAALAGKSDLVIRLLSDMNSFQKRDLLLEIKNNKQENVIRVVMNAENKTMNHYVFLNYVSSLK